MTKSILGSVDKIAYQTYTVELGIERLKIQVPLKTAKVFESEFQKAISLDKPKEDLLTIINKHGGFRRKNRE